MPDVDDESKVKLLSCLDEVRNIVGESASDQQIVDTIMRCNYDMTAALDSILNSTSNAAEASRKTTVQSNTVKLPPGLPAAGASTMTDKGEY